MAGAVVKQKECEKIEDSVSLAVIST